MVAAIASAGTLETAIGELIPGTLAPLASGRASALSAPADVAAASVAELPSLMMTGGVPVPPNTRSGEAGPSENSRSTIADPLRAQRVSR
ncbi:hypothetical protein [Accumulibacter sp.]|uniref:hypothetical protein n=1 Tax=Accumulibacter sp. TaxID=2053492 RepID=UPI0026159E65|nr:hypothetical protein [Accumulibacter sp.]